MKGQILLSLILLNSVLSMKAQWIGTNPIWTNSNIGIGIQNPQSPLHISSMYGPGNEVIANRGLIIGGGGSSGILNMGINYASSSGNFYSWVQSRGINYNNHYFSLALNPFGGKVGIGTEDPQSTLHILSSLGPGNETVANRGLIIGGSGSTGILNMGIDYASTTGIFYSWIQSRGTNYNSQYFPLALNPYGGSVCIGTTTPDSRFKLDVEGTIRASEVKVCLQGGCDFVFKNDYKLMDLIELERYVKTNQHLPEIASEKEMVEDGVNMKELQMKLLQKIEELTLYTIEQNKKNELQSREIELLKQEIVILKGKK